MAEKEKGKVVPLRKPDGTPARRRASTILETNVPPEQLAGMRRMTGSEILEALVSGETEIVMGKAGNPRDNVRVLFHDTEGPDNGENGPPVH